MRSHAFAADLPRTIDEPIIQRIEIEGLPIVTYAVRVPSMTIEELSWFVDDTVKRRLQSVSGVSAVDRIGGVLREIHVTLDPTGLLSLGITAGDVNAQLRATNIDLAGGRGEIAEREQAIRTLAGKKSVADLAATSIALPGGATSGSTNSAPSPTAGKSRAPSPSSMANPSSPSPSRAARAPAT